jgi:co-chaperonin GroES (HSP10)
MRPLADRVLVVPDLPSDTTDSGLKVVRTWNPVTQGRVSAIGDRVRDVKVGDSVLFSWQVGQDITFEGDERYIVLREKEIDLVLEGDSVT